ncbi:MAG TPA: hypothetical protein VIK32_04810 [Candidatus Limnocylindrales bacterium]
MSRNTRRKAAAHTARLEWIHPLAWMILLAAFILGIGLLSDALHPDLAYGYYTKAQAKRLTTAQVKSIIRDEAKKAHLGKADTAALIAICKPESNFHPTSHSRSQCHGLFQLSRGMAHGHPWWDPRWNTRRAIRYIRYSSHHYRTPRRALAFRRVHHWY